MLRTDPAAVIEEGLDKLARHAAWVLLAIAGLGVALAALLWVAGEAEPQRDLVISGMVQAVLFGGLGLWARRSPFIPVVIGTALYGVGLFFMLVANPLAVLSMWGLVVHGVLIVLCINGVQSAREYEKLRRRFAARSG